MYCTVDTYKKMRIKKTEQKDEKITKNDEKRNETSTSRKPNIKIIFIKKFYGIKFLLYDINMGSRREKERESEGTRAVVWKDQPHKHTHILYKTCQNEVK